MLKRPERQTRGTVCPHYHFWPVCLEKLSVMSCSEQSVNIRGCWGSLDRWGGCRTTPSDLWVSVCCVMVTRGSSCWDWSLSVLPCDIPKWKVCVCKEMCKGKGKPSRVTTLKLIREWGYMGHQHVWDFKGERTSDQMRRDRRSLKGDDDALYASTGPNETDVILITLTVLFWREQDWK